MRNNERMIRALAHPVYRRLFGAQVVALAGTGLATVALGLLAYDLAGAGAGAVLGTVFAVKMLAYVLVAPVAAVVLARVPRRAVLIGADVLRLLVALTLPFVGEVWQVVVLVFVLQAASATFTPTFQSVIPQVLPDEDDYTSALSLSRLAYDLEAVLSPVLAAALLLVMSSDALFVGTALGFAGSALLVGSVVLPRAVVTVQAPFRAELRRGAELFVRTAALRPVLALNLVVAAAGAFVLVQTVVVVRGELGLGEGVVALVLAALGAGSMAAALALPRLLRGVAERRVMLGGAVLLTAATAVIPFALGSLPAVVALWMIVGVGWAAVETPVGRLIRREVPVDGLPAAFAAQFSLSHACWLVTYPLAGWLGTVGLGTAAIVLAVVAAAGTVTATFLWPSRARVASLPS